MANPEILPCDAAAIRAAVSVPACAARRGWVLAAAVLGSTLAYVDESVINVALPKLESDLHTTLAAMQWVINAYTLCMSALLLIGGATADQFGRRRIFLIGVAVFATASLVCALAPEVRTLIGARALQGVGAALLVPCSLALIAAAYDEKERGAAIGIWSGASAIAAGAAPLLGGALVDHASWRAIFVINPVLAVPTIWITLRHVPESRDSQAGTSVDWPGALLACLGLAALVYALIAAETRGWTEIHVVAGLAAGVIALGAFVLTERRSRAPMMPLELFHSRTFSGINLLTLLLYGALGAAFFFLPFLLIQARGYSATATGATYLPFTVVLGVLSRWAGGLVDRFGARRPLIIGPALTAAGFALLAVRAAPYPIVLLSMTVIGFGMTITVAPLTTAVLNAVPGHRTGVASGINNAVASVGSLLMIALLGTVALGVFDRSLERHLAHAPASPALARVVESARGGFVIPPMPPGLTALEQQQARTIIASSLEDTVALIQWIACALVLASALTAAVAIEDTPRLRASGTPPHPS